MPQYNANLFSKKKTPECVLTLSKVRSEYQEEERRKKKQFHIQFQKVLTIFFFVKSTKGCIRIVFRPFI